MATANITEVLPTGERVTLASASLGFAGGLIFELRDRLDAVTDLGQRGRLYLLANTAAELVDSAGMMLDDEVFSPGEARKLLFQTFGEAGRIAAGQLGAHEEQS